MPSQAQAYPWVSTYPDMLDWNLDIPVHPVYDLLDATAQKFADRPAFDFLGKQYTWAEISDLVDKFAAGLQRDGLEKGMKVGLFLPNSPYFLISYYAVLKAGGTVVHFNPLYAEAELSHQIEDSETEIMITCDLKMLHEKMEKMLHATRLNKIVFCKFTDVLPFPKNVLFSVLKAREIATIPISKRHVWFHNLIDHDEAPAYVDIDPHTDLAVLQYTGGTTGVPKGAMLTHRNVVANAVQAGHWFSDCRPGQDKMLGVLPFFHVFAMTAVMNLSVLKGLEIVAIPRFDLDQTLALINKKKPHIFPAVPAIFSAINTHKKLEKYDLSSLRYCVSGGAPLPVEVKRNFEDKTGSVVVEGYGLTESAPVLCCNPPTGENKPGSIGLPLPGVVIDIVDPEDKKTLIPIGERGELCARGPQVMAGYWNNPDATKDTMSEVDGVPRLHTGDIAIMDEDGYFFIVDRIKDLIITNGYNVYPRNVEEAIYQHPSVEECIVAGIPDKQRGEIVKAWIKCREDRTVTPEDLKHFLKDKISPMEIPKRIEFREEPLPKTMIGKLSRKDIVEQELQKKS